MSRREHLVLRAAGLLLLVMAAIWPSSRGESRSDLAERAAVGHALRGDFETTAARPSANELPRPRSLRLVASGPE